MLEQVNQAIFKAFGHNLPVGCSDAPDAPVDYSEAFDLCRRLDDESEVNFESMIKFAERIALEEHRVLDDVVGELQEALHDARVEVQKRIMAVYAKIAQVDICQ